MSQKKILIITHRPRSNYGGIAQAYALQQIIKKLGHSVETTASLGSPYLRYVASNPLLRKIFRKGPLRNNEMISRITRKFVEDNIVEVPLSIAKKKSRHGFYDLYISGSDQVWRARYSYLPDYLFSFVKTDSAPRISYAASFGKDNLDEFSPSLKKKTRRLAQKFEAISVRENSGVKIVKEYWGLDAYHHIDPTLLLDVSHYENLISNSALRSPRNEKNGLFTYILDPSHRSQAIVDFAQEVLKLTPYSLIESDLNAGRTLPAFEEWLKCFKEADFVITDSFHGTVFSIIFNKPFLAIGNEHRGLARFRSLLELFCLKERLVLDSHDVSRELLMSPVDWRNINEIMQQERTKSYDYLKGFL